MTPKSAVRPPLSAYIRTDLACESPAPAVSAEEETVATATRPVTLTRREEADGGRSVTLFLGRITERGESELPELSRLLARELRDMAACLLGGMPDGNTRVLVAGLGNAAMTPDAIGPEVLRRLTVTRHLKTYDGSLFSALG
jgi:spore protease